MIRVKDISASLDFYTKVLGMTQIREHKSPENKFDLYFLAYAHSPSANPDQRQREAILELTYNYGTEQDPDFKYHDGNSEPKGYGHIAITVDDLDDACQRFDDKGVVWKKRLTDGKIKDIAFFADPDGYWIEVLQNEALKPRAKW
jgi:lactoylglutathione lyase